jgi:hypothetical protein
MRYVPLLSLLSIFIATTALAAPWDRLKPSAFRRAPRTPTADAPWVEERQIDPYLIRSEFPLKDVHELVQDLGDLKDDLERELRLKCEPQEIQIHLFSSKRSYDRYLSIRVPEGTRRQALYMPGAGDVDGRVYAYRHNDLDTDVRHETTHALLHTALPYVPIWIDEGIAEYFEVSPSLRVKGNSHRREIQTAIRFQRWRPDIEQLEDKRKLLDMDGKDYRDSWAIVHFLLNGPKEARQALDNYFEQIQSGDVPTPISQQLRERIPNIDQTIIDHLMN